MDKRGKKILRIVLCDILAIGVGLVVFSYFHHGRMQEVEPVKLEKPQTEAPVLQTTPEPAAESIVPDSEPEQKPEQGQNLLKKQRTNRVKQHRKKMPVLTKERKKNKMISV